MAGSNPKGSREYWQRRALKLEQRANEKAENMASRLLGHYQRAAGEMEKQIAVFYSRYAGEQGVSYREAQKALNSREAQEWSKSLGEYVEEITALPPGPAKDKRKAELDARAYRSRITRLDALKGQLDLEVERLAAKTQQSLHSGLGEVYQDSYYRKLFHLEQRAGKQLPFARLNSKMVEEILAYPWSGADFSTRLWQNKQALLFHTREVLTQSVIQGKSVTATTKELAAVLETSYHAAERLIRTEANHLHNQADRDAYAAVGVEEYEFLAFMDSRTSKVCAGLDGKVFPAAKAKTGENYPPMHPNCRSTTVERLPPGWEDATPAREPTEKEYKEWLAGVFNREKGKGGQAFNIREEQEHYRQFLQNMPEKNRMYLEQAMDAVEYKEKEMPMSFGYSRRDDVVYYNPAHEEFGDIEFCVANTHELSHRVDAQFVSSWKNKEFSAAVAQAQETLDKAYKDLQKYCKEQDKEGFFSDILSAICGGKYEFGYEHDVDYWQVANSKEIEVFANLFSLEAYEDTEKMELVQQYFPEIWKAYKQFIL